MDLQKVLGQFGIVCDVRILLDKWNESHRYHHDMSHLVNLVEQINEDYGNGLFSENEKNKLIVSAIFHDIIYEPGSNMNEHNSSEFFLGLCREKFDIDVVEIKQIILDTKNHVGSTPLSKKFQEYDMKICESNLENLMNWEANIRKEYSSYTSDDYKRSRILFLESILDRYPNNMDNILDLINYVQSNY